VGVPDARGREAILHVHTKRIRLEPHVNIRAMAQRKELEGFSGAQLACLVNEAALLAVRLGDTCVHERHFDMAIVRHKVQHNNNSSSSSR
jgi:cell division protease FtsH